MERGSANGNIPSVKSQPAACAEPRPSLTSVHTAPFERPSVLSCSLRGSHPLHAHPPATYSSPLLPLPSLPRRAYPALCVPQSVPTLSSKRRNTAAYGCSRRPCLAISHPTSHLFPVATPRPCHKRVEMGSVQPPSHSISHAGHKRPSRGINRQALPRRPPATRRTSVPPPQ